MAMIGAFLVVWTPYAILSMLVLITGTDFTNSALALLPILATKTSTFLNPTFYVVLNPQFQKAFMNLFEKAGSNAEEASVTQVVAVKYKAGEESKVLFEGKEDNV